MGATFGAYAPDAGGYPQHVIVIKGKIIPTYKIQPYIDCGKRRKLTKNDTCLDCEVILERGREKNRQGRRRKQ